MKRFSFKKGIHPKYNKDETCNKAIEILMPGLELVFPMQQHIGAPCKPTVKKGDRVLVGQCIGEVDAYVSAAIFSSVSGTVKAVEDRMTGMGIKVISVVVENDGLFESAESLKNDEVIDYTKLTAEMIVEKVKNAGLVGMGGATFPTHIKLNPPKDKVIKHIIVNGAECEPYLTSDHRLMLEESERIIEGIKILLHMFPESAAYIGVEDNKIDAIQELEKNCLNEQKIKIIPLNTKYPQGSEKHLIYSVTKKEVPGGKLPADIGCIVLNVDSIVAIWRAVTKNRPIIRRIVTIQGSGVANPVNVKVRLGTSYRELLEYAKWDEDSVVKVISGGPMMGQTISSVDIPVVKGTSAILCFTEKEVTKTSEYNCLRCGKCVEVCPMRLIPSTLNQDALLEQDEHFLEMSGMDCIECGCCSYICPSKRHLVQSIRTEKNKIRQKQSK
ncbi:MAG: electron transport complex subunit RsxC [Cellulosilyticaceae bacterium]